MFSKFFINRPAFSAVIGIIIVIAGLLCIFNLAIKWHPKLVPNQIVVQTTYSSADARTLSATAASALK
ncbi:hypothetical protein BKN38_06960 [Helicobacter sp. CLO-3]|uniref:efflux RND transporter permease subunit n=1 Tax=unclassified Helicobacter TaxID=2593540 RepID=UPI0008052490|nr:MULTISPECIES: efflux RND transporter permease subunit [unclassified Helicobacter]OBV28611.1 hypothetical protein BA723_01705 [Helicobacter sp. CLO-3]OHU82508.1 hypothetical protein BKN38_06960 [Helicobacter sp. CLO-3]